MLQITKQAISCMVMANVRGKPLEQCDCSVCDGQGHMVVECTKITYETKHEHGLLDWPPTKIKQCLHGIKSLRDKDKEPESA